jgi:hypothetical protein
MTRSRTIGARIYALDRAGSHFTSNDSIANGRHLKLGA